ncbi:hypothetical protein P280DRAFT_517636 [Massarina eburnea CBS 473.64]|uniref:Uncharacterized protein n=1 Tax=Massarina eburnea CBS 473.64 TaxID=1395130 RepID=A0A6A6S5J6_9PLEO|nr:hypothetical protein P280DRAFT_517636 [Massarina eburnea CBS 473.64]
MKFSTIVATIVSMAVFAVAAPIDMEAREAVADNGNHGMCVKGAGGEVTQITNC